jgi:hypothetical protein
VLAANSLEPACADILSRSNLKEAAIVSPHWATFIWFDPRRSMHCVCLQRRLVVLFDQSLSGLFPLILLGSTFFRGLLSGPVQSLTVLLKSSTPPPVAAAALAHFIVLIIAGVVIGSSCLVHSLRVHHFSCSTFSFAPGCACRPCTSDCCTSAKHYDWSQKLLPDHAALAAADLRRRAGGGSLAEP